MVMKCQISIFIVLATALVKFILTHLITTVKIFSATLLFILSTVAACAQQNITDSFRTILQRAGNDSLRYEASRTLYNYYEEINRVSALFYAELDLSAVFPKR
jgi:hypothetical protein